MTPGAHRAGFLPLLLQLVTLGQWWRSLHAPGPGGTTLQSTRHSVGTVLRLCHSAQGTCWKEMHPKEASLESKGLRNEEKNPCKSSVWILKKKQKGSSMVQHKNRLECPSTMAGPTQIYCDPLPTQVLGRSEIGRREEPHNTVLSTLSRFIFSISSI